MVVGVVLLWEEVICQRQTPIVRDLCGEALVPFIADLGNDVVVEGELVVGRNDQIRIDIPDLEKQSYQLFASATRHARRTLRASSSGFCPLFAK